MDTYMRTLSFNKGMQVEDVVQPCFKIMRWMNLTEETVLNYMDIETVWKGGIYINQCSIMFGWEKLLEALKKRYPLYKDVSEKRVKQFVQHGCMSTICSQILLTKNGQNAFLILERLKQASKDKFNLNLKITYVTEQLKAENELETASRNRKHLHYMLQKMFHLQVDQIEPAIQRAIEYMPFEVLGYTFMEPAWSGFLDVCTIMEQKILDHLIQCSIPANFVRSLFVSASNTDIGMRFYLMCLANKKFSHSLSVFFVAYFKTIRAVDGNNGEEYFSSNIEFKKYGFIDIAFLVHCALLPESPCRFELQQSLLNPNLPPNVMDILNKTVLIYD